MKTFTDLEQSKRLAEFLPLESADMYHYYTKEELTLKGSLEVYHVHIPFNKANYEWYKSTNDSYIPCWSLSALLNVLPKSVRLVGTPKDPYWYCECVDGNNQWYAGFGSADNAIDACVDMIEKLHEQKLL